MTREEGDDKEVPSTTTGDNSNSGEGGDAGMAGMEELIELMRRQAILQRQHQLQHVKTGGSGGGGVASLKQQQPDIATTLTATKPTSAMDSKKDYKDTNNNNEGGGTTTANNNITAATRSSRDGNSIIPHHAFWETQPMLHERLAALCNAAAAPSSSSAAAGGGSVSASSSPSTALSTTTPPTTAGDTLLTTGTQTLSNNTNNQQLQQQKEVQHGPITPNKEQSAIRQEPYNMPRGFEWTKLNIQNQFDCFEIYDLLSKNYVEDDDCMFRFDYSIEFLKWALSPPGYVKDFHIGVRPSSSPSSSAEHDGTSSLTSSSSTTTTATPATAAATKKKKKLIAFISGVPAHIRAFHKSNIPMVEINFLCVHKKLRSKRLAPVLIKEITRRVNLHCIFQAVYTAGIVLPVPAATCRYYHRSLDPKKLIEVGFSRLGPRMTIARTQKLFKLPSELSTPGLRPMTPNDVPSAHKLLSNYLKKFHLVPIMSEAEFAHWLLPREGVVSSYVTKSSKTGEVTDLCSFYHLPSTVIGNAKHKTLRAAYCFYNAATTVELIDLMRDCLILARKENQDVFNALNVMENGTVLEELKFGIGDGRLQYYLYNWSCPSMEAKDIGLVLL